MKISLKNNTGITLIALVITIIVLLILAGVSISMLTGDNGILTQATEAKKENIKGKEKEQIGLAWQSLKLGRQADNKIDPISDTELKNQLVADGEKENNVEVTGGTEKLTINYKDSGNSYTIDQDGKIESEEKDKIGKLSEVANVGDYVNYNVEYTNVDLEGYGKLKDNIGTGWRISYIDRENDIVKLIPEGMPLLETKESDIGNLVDDTVATEINLMELEDIKKICEQSVLEFTDDTIYGEGLDPYTGGPLIVLNRYEINNDILDLICIGATYRINTIGKHIYGDSYKMSVHPEGIDTEAVVYYDQTCGEENYTYGIRPVITLKAGIEFKGGDGTKSNSFKIY